MTLRYVVIFFSISHTHNASNTFLMKNFELKFEI